MSVCVLTHLIRPFTAQFDHPGNETTAVAAQNSALTDKAGAFTGELPTPLLKDFGINWVIIGALYITCVVVMTS